MSPELLGSATIRYKKYIYNNLNTSPACVTINVFTSACGTTLHSSAYAGNYDPTSISSDYLGDAGFSSTNMTYTVTLPPLTNLVVVVNETDVNACTGTFTVTVNGVNNACPTFTPTITSTPTVIPTPICPNAWTYQAPYPINILDQAVAAQNGKLYSFGGISNGQFVSNTYAYDTGTNTWTALATLPIMRENASAVTDGAYIYIVGGTNAVDVYRTTNYRYDPVANTYAIMTPMSLGVSAAASAYLGGKIYRIGGIGTGNVYTNTAEAYTIATDTWAPIANYPQSIGFLYVTSIGSSIYTAGGTGTTDSGKTYRYDVGTNTWIDADIADLPATRWGGTSGVLNGHWVIAGGFVNGLVSSNVLAWNPASNTWLPLDPMLQPLARGLGGAAGNALYSVGGSDVPGAFAGRTDNMHYGAACLNTVTPTNTPTNTPTSTPVLVGHVVWQGRPAQPNTLQGLPVTFTLKMGTTEINYLVQTTDASGFFTVGVGSLLNGTYSWRAKNPKYLAISGLINLIGATRASLEIGQMKAGDANNDNVVTTLDFNILKSTLGKTVGDPGYDARADFNGDVIVNVGDFNLLRGNFGLVGGPPILPGKW